MKKIIIFVVLVIFFYHTASAQILRPFPEPEIKDLVVENFGVPGLSFLANDSSNEIYFGWADSLYDAYPAYNLQLLDGSVVSVIILDSVEQKENIKLFIKKKITEGIPLGQVLKKVNTIYEWGLLYKTEWTRYLCIF